MHPHASTLCRVASTLPSCQQYRRSGNVLGTFLFPGRNKFIRISLTWRESLIPLREICERHDEMVSFWNESMSKRCLRNNELVNQSHRVYVTWIFIEQEFFFSEDMPRLAFLRRDAFTIFLNKTVAKCNRRRIILCFCSGRNWSRFVSKYFAFTRY